MESVILEEDIDENYEVRVLLDASHALSFKVDSQP